MHPYLRFSENSSEILVPGSSSNKQLLKAIIQFSTTDILANIARGTTIVGKKRDPGMLDPELFLAQIRKVEARLGKLAKIRKSVIN